MAKTVNKKLDRLIQWVVFILVFSAFPYLLRLFLFWFWRKEVPTFYIAELDIYAFSIAVLIALFSELKKLKKLPYDLSNTVCDGILMFYMAIIVMFIGISLNVEHDIIKLHEKKDSLLKIGVNTESILEEMKILEFTVFRLYLVSIFFAFLTTFVSYKTLFHPDND